MMIRRTSEINHGALREDHKDAQAMVVVISWAWAQLGTRLGIIAKPSDDNDGHR